MAQARRASRPFGNLMFEKFGKIVFRKNNKIVRSRHALLYDFDVTCYEGQNQVGGLWNYKPMETDGELL